MVGSAILELGIAPVGISKDRNLEWVRRGLFVASMMLLLEAYGHHRNSARVFQGKNAESEGPCWNVGHRGSGRLIAERSGCNMAEWRKNVEQCVGPRQLLFS